MDFLLTHIFQICALLIVALLIAVLWVILDIRHYFEIQVTLLTRLDKTNYKICQQIEEFHYVANELRKTRKQP
jgi:hypothetical protein